MRTRTRLFRSGNSLAVRIPKDWAPESEFVILRREGKRLIITEEGEDLRALARRFAVDGPISFDRPPQPQTPPAPRL